MRSLRDAFGPDGLLAAAMATIGQRMKAMNPFAGHALRRKRVSRRQKLRDMGYERQAPSPEQAETRRLVSNMTNWQRTQYSRALSAARREGRSVNDLKKLKLARAARIAMRHARSRAELAQAVRDAHGVG